MFLRDAIILAEQNSCGPPSSNATNAATGATAGATAGATEHGSKAPRIHNATDAMYVRLMGRVVQIHSCDDAAGGNNDDDVSSFVIDDGTASVHVVVGQLRQQHQQQHRHPQVGLPSAAKRPRLQTGTTVSEPDVELGVLVDCVGYLSLAAAEMDAPLQEAANAEEDQNGDCADVDGNDEKLDAGKSKEQQDQDYDNIANATDSSEPKQDATEDADEPRKEQPYCASPTNDGEEPAQTTVLQNEEYGECEESSHHSDGQQARPIFDAILSAVTVATVSHPDAESLRTLELILAASSTNSSSDQANDTSTSGDIGGNANDAIQGIHIASGLVSKIGAFQHRSQEHQWHSSPAGNSAEDQQQSQVTSEVAYSVCSNTAFRFIRSAAADGGISEEDLAVALGCICGSGSNKRKSIIRRRSGGTSGRPSELGNNAEVMAVRRVLQELQAGGEIYKTRRGTYLPL